jgi:SAM-dependent methyltransferase
MRILEIGCGPGAAARLAAAQVGDGFVLGIDRSAAAITQAVRGSAELIAAGTLRFRQSEIESFELGDGEPPFDLAFALRVGALDGRHPSQGAHAMTSLRKALKPGSLLYIDGGSPLRAIDPFE